MEMRFQAVVTIESQISTSIQSNLMYVSCTDPEWGGQRVWTPWKITKLLSQHSIMGHHWPTGEMPFKWHFAGGPMMTRFYGNWILSPLIKKVDKTFWVRACV